MGRWLFWSDQLVEQRGDTDTSYYGKNKLTNQENMSELALCWHQSKVTEEHWDVAANEKGKEWAKSWLKVKSWFKIQHDQPTP